MIKKFDIEKFLRFRSQIVCYGFFGARKAKGQKISHNFDMGCKDQVPLSNQNCKIKRLVFELYSKGKDPVSLNIQVKCNSFNTSTLYLAYLRFCFLKIASRKRRLNLLQYALKSYVFKKKFKGYVLLLFGSCVYLPKKHSFLPYSGSCILVKLLSFVRENIVVSQRILINTKSKNLSKFYLYKLI